MSAQIFAMSLAIWRNSGLDTRMAGRVALTIGIVATCFGLLADRLSDIALSEVLAAMAAIPTEAVLWGLVFGLVSHLALAGYDLLALTRVARRLPWPRALMGGFAGTVTGQVLGFGLVTGALARARIYRANGISAAQAVALSGYVATGFYMGLSVLLAMLLLWPYLDRRLLVPLHPILVASIAVGGFTLFERVPTEAARKAILGAATVWLRVGKTLVMQAVRRPCSAMPRVARRPAPPAPITMQSYSWVS